MKPRCFLQLSRCLIITLVALGLLTACQKDGTAVMDPPPPTLPPTLTNIQIQIFTPRCAFTGCHGDQSTQPAAQPQNLSDGKAYNSIVNVPSLQRPGLMRVKPGDPANSYLVRKLEAGPDVTGGTMPGASSPLDPALIKMVKDWIADGAKNN
jgi:hypothetical protein